MMAYRTAATPGLRMSRWLRFARFVVVALLAWGCASEPQRPGTYTVRSGDTLYSIAWRNDLDYHELARWNHIGRDYAIYPGQVLRLTPPGHARVDRTTHAPTRTHPSERRADRPLTAADRAIKWQWPTASHAAELTTRPNGGQGLTIKGKLGEEIRAAAAGRVVYTGSGLLGYGQLVIVQHSDTFLSAYGHAQTVRVHEQQEVRAGEPIATMGMGPNGTPMLYFEIRINGRPIDPTEMLPK